MRADSKTSRAFSLLPLALLAFMAVLGLVLEAARARAWSFLILLRIFSAGFRSLRDVHWSTLAKAKCFL